MLIKGDLILEAIDKEDLIFLPHLMRAENEIARLIARLCGLGSVLPEIDFERAVIWSEERAQKQLEAS